MAKRKTQVLVGAAALGLVGVVGAAGGHLTSRQSGTITELSQPYVFTAEKYDIEMLGWRNVSVNTGSVSANVQTSTAGTESAVKILTDATHPTIQATGEAGYRIVWIDSSPPPGPVPLLVSYAVSFTGNSGFLEFNPDPGTGRVDLSIYEYNGEGGLGLKEFTQDVTLTQGGDGRYTAEVWLPIPAVKVESPTGSLRPSAEFGIAVEPHVASSPAPSDLGNVRH